MYSKYIHVYNAYNVHIYMQMVNSLCLVLYSFHCFMKSKDGTPSTLNNKNCERVERGTGKRGRYLKFLVLKYVQQ